MKEFLLEILVCPGCKDSLRLSNATYADGEIESGILICACGKAYPIKDGIPRFVSSDGYVSNFSFEWKRFSKTQLDSFNGTQISANRFQEVTSLDSEQLKGKTVLEIGCGMGRFLEIAAKQAAEVIRIDLSFSVDAARSNLKGFTNVHLVQADIFNMPFAENRFDLIYSIGVLHHTPKPKDAFLHLPNLLSGNGILAMWISPRSRFPWLPKATHLSRFFTSRMRARTLFHFVKGFVPLALPFVRIPFIGRLLKGWVIPICDYRGELPLNKHQLLEWSILDTFDLLSAKHLYSYRPRDIKDWFIKAGIFDIVTASPLVIIRGRRQRETVEAKLQ